MIVVSLSYHRMISIGTPILKRTILFSLLVLTHLFFSYYYFGGWWHSSIGTLLILFFSYLIWGKDFLRNVGLQLDIKTVVKSVILALIVASAAFAIMQNIAASNKVLIQWSDLPAYYHDVFYILNEEIVVGAMLLFALVNKSKIKPMFASIGLAVFFSMMHFAFYKWVVNDSATIEVSTLVTLFFVGILRNNLILQTGHVGYSWALHFGWMLVMFGSSHVDMATKLDLTEPVRFNIYLGSAEVLIISMLLAGFSLIYWKRKALPMSVESNPETSNVI